MANLALLGAGNMGTAMAHALACGGHQISLWDHFPEVVDAISRERGNRRFLPGIRLHDGIKACPRAAECVEGAQLVVICVPSPFVSDTLLPLLPVLQPGAILLNVAKGFAPGTREPLPFLLTRMALGHPCVHLAGPAIANEFGRGLTTSVVMASASPPAARTAAEIFSGEIFEASVTDDVQGAALGGILKNVYAILLGCVDRLSGGSRNMEAAVLTACIREMADIAAAHGGRRSTLFGLAGLGDLVATGFSEDSHNRSFGQRLAAGESAASIRHREGWLPEGAAATTAACGMAQEKDLPAFLANWVRQTLAGSPPTLEGLSQALRNAS
jgi:glycerol-3-phosphate dehydrogenase (NAD(P)+)